MKITKIKNESPSSFIFMIEDVKHTLYNLEIEYTLFFWNN